MPPTASKMDEARAVVRRRCHQSMRFNMRAASLSIAILVDPAFAVPARVIMVYSHMVMEKATFKIETIYVPVKRMKTLDKAIVDEIAESMLEEGQLTPILVRPDGDRYVLVEGLHRLEACKALGEETVEGMIVRARRH
ncbi:ParB N-terminal domain-containing protein [Hoeflea sp. TYP-13]|uniref:ParB N-terminal domain-containing protein n=1 Tax=Hoeflea sp. TYP-13 TaxID=3230023 RepID=UPI0034C5DB2B